jgi:hypothetical protein
VQIHAEDVGAMVLLDHISRTRLRLPREGSSDRALWERVRAAAEAVGVGPVFPPATGKAILDDHTPFLRAGIPAVDLIDWDFAGEQRPTEALDPRGIDAVGETIVGLVAGWRDV